MRAAIAHFRSEEDDKLQFPHDFNHDQPRLAQRSGISPLTKSYRPLQDLEDSLHPAVNYFIIPLFAYSPMPAYFCSTCDPEEIVSGVSLAVICGLVAGKFCGIIDFHGSQ